MLHVINKAVVWENGFVKELLVALKLTFSQFIYLFIFFYTEVNQRGFTSSCILILQINHPLPLLSLTYLKCFPEARVALVPLPEEPSLS